MHPFLILFVGMVVILGAIIVLRLNAFLALIGAAIIVSFLSPGAPGLKIARVAEASGVTILRTPFRAPRANAVCERFLGSVRRECLDNLLFFGERHLRRVLREYVAYFNRARPHQGLEQALPEPSAPEVAGSGEKPASHSRSSDGAGSR